MADANSGKALNKRMMKRRMVLLDLDTHHVVDTITVLDVELVALDVLAGSGDEHRAIQRLRDMRSGGNVMTMCITEDDVGQFGIADLEESICADTKHFSAHRICHKEIVVLCLPCTYGLKAAECIQSRELMSVFCFEAALYAAEHLVALHIEDTVLDIVVCGTFVDGVALCFRMENEIYGRYYVNDVHLVIGVHIGGLKDKRLRVLMRDLVHLGDHIRYIHTHRTVCIALDSRQRTCYDGIREIIGVE